MSLTVRNDEQIRVGVTTGLVTGSSSFTFDGTGGKPDYRNYEIVPTEINGRGILVKNTDYSWNSTTGAFNWLQLGDVFENLQWFNIHFQLVSVPLVADKAAIINYSFFIRNINIPNIDPVNLQDAPTLERLNSFISKYEPECLQKILGYALYKVFLSENTDRMDWLLYGKEYTDERGDLQKWQGLVHDNMSLIANYIYFHFQQTNASQTSAVGTNIPKGEASQSFAPLEKMVNAFNFFSSETKDLLYFLWNFKITGSRVYPEFTSYNFYDTQRMSRPINMFGI